MSGGFRQGHFCVDQKLMNGRGFQHPLLRCSQYRSTPWHVWALLKRLRAASPDLLTRCQDSFVHHHFHFHTSILLSALQGFIRCDWVRDPHRSRRNDVPRRNLAFLHKIVHDGKRPIFAQRLVGGSVSRGIGESLNLNDVPGELRRTGSQL